MRKNSKNWLYVLLAVSFLTHTACDLKSDQAVQLVQAPDPDAEFDDNATATLTVPTLNQNIIRTRAILNDSIAVNNGQAAAGIARAGSNLPTTTDPGKIFPTALGSMLIVDWGFCAVLAVSQTPLNAYGVNRGLSLTDNMAKLEAMGVSLFIKGTGIPESSPPAAVPTLYGDLHKLLKAQLADLKKANATLDQATAAVCLASIYGAKQIGF